MNLENGATYAVRHRSGQQKYPRESVMRLLGYERSRGGALLTLIFDARPIAGTQRFSMESIIDIRKVNPTTPLSMNRVLK